MRMILWLILVTGYAFLTGAAEKRRGAGAVLCFLNGSYLALLCLSVLPSAMGTAHFYGTAAVAAVGVLAGLRTEEKPLAGVLVFALVTGYAFLRQGGGSGAELLFLAFFGGMGLYNASCGILPEGIEIGKALLSGAGFLLGTVLFAAF